jgi:hypothetical protein
MNANERRSSFGPAMASHDIACHTNARATRPMPVPGLANLRPTGMDHSGTSIREVLEQIIMLFRSFTACPASASRRSCLMACLTEIYRPPCCKCDELATVELRDRKGLRHGVYCEKHGKTALTQIHELETAPMPRTAEGPMVGAQRCSP